MRFISSVAFAAVAGVISAASCLAQDAATQPTAINGSEPVAVVTAPPPKPAVLKREYAQTEIRKPVRSRVIYVPFILGTDH